MRWYGVYGLRSVALRYFNVAGASAVNGEDHEPETHLIPNLLRAAASGTPVTLFGEDYPTPDGTAVRDYIHVQDLADAHMLALEWTAGRSGGRERDLQPGVEHRLQRAAGARRCRVGRRSAHPACVRPPACGRPAGARWRPPIAPGDVLGWTPARGSLDEMIGSAWSWMGRAVDTIAMMGTLGVERSGIHVPQTILAEAAQVVTARAGRTAWSSMLRGILDSDWRVEPVTDEDLRRCTDLMDAYADSRMDFVDASVMAVAERLGARRIYTLDRRDFSMVRPRHVDAFELLP